MTRVVLLFTLFLFTPVAHAQDSFAGKWGTNFGQVTLTQNGNKVRGSYYEGRASLEGQVEKGKLTFTYKEQFEEGDGEFVLAADSKSFTGRYRTKGQQLWHEWNGKYEGKVAVPVVGKGASYSGTWKTTYDDLILVQEGDTVKGSYYNGTATIEGKVVKGRLQFKFVENLGKGDGEFELSADGKSFTGRWRWENEQLWHDWNGKQEK